MQQDLVENFQNYVEVLRFRSNLNADKIAFTFLQDGEHLENNITYSQLWKDAEKIGAYLQSICPAREPILLLYPPGLEFIKSFLGCLIAGNIAIPSYLPKGNRSYDRIEAIMKNSESRLILTQRNTLNDKLVKQLQSECYQIIYTDQVPDDFTFASLPVTIDSTDVAFLQYTSGSTGTPKGVIINHGNLLHNQKMLCKAFRQNEHSTIVGWLPFYHDMGLVGNILHPIYIGAKAVLMSPMHFLQKPARWLLAISKYKATVSGAPNFAYDLCINIIKREEIEGIDLSTWNSAFCGAEPVRAATIQEFAEAFKPYNFLVNAFQPCYGMAEATLLVSAGQYNIAPLIKAFNNNFSFPQTLVDNFIDTKVELVSCGDPNAFECKVIIVDQKGEIVSDGDVGEIWILSKSVSPGYWRKQNASNQISEAEVGDNCSKYFKTGDLGIFYDNQLYICGRLKEMLVINGRNIYPQEIENFLCNSSSLLIKNRSAAFSIDVEGVEELVIISEIKTGNEDGIRNAASEIRKVISGELGLNVYEIILIRVNTILRTTSGKIQRLACREAYLKNELVGIVHRDKSSKFIGRRGMSNLKFEDKSEAIVLNVLEQVSGLNNINVKNNIFELGINSINIVEVLLILKEALNKEIPLDVFLNGYDIEEMILKIDKLPSTSLVDIEKVQPTEYFELSIYQKGIIFDMMSNPDNTAYNLPICYNFGSALNIRLFEKALSIVVDRHDILRSSFPNVGGKIVQKIQANLNITLPVKHLSGSHHIVLENTVIKASKRIFKLEVAPLFDARIFYFNGEYYFFYITHHLISDGTSLQLIIKELEANYKSLLNGQEIKSYKNEIQYQNFAAWGHSDLLASNLLNSCNYWINQLADFRSSLILPYDHVGVTDGNNTQSNTVRFELDISLSKELRNTAIRNKATLYSILLTGFLLLLKRLTNENDILICCPISIRDKRELLTAQGLFVNTILLRNIFTEQDNYQSSIDRIKTTLYEGMSHKLYPLTSLIEELSKHTILNKFQIPRVSFNDLNFFDTASSTELFNIFQCNTSLESNYDLNFYLSDSSEQIQMRVDYNAALFEHETINHIVIKYVQILRKLISNPSHLINAPLETLPIISVPSNDAIWYHPSKTVVDVLYNSFNLYQNNIAIQTDKEEYTYQIFNIITNRFARYLLNFVINQNIGLYMRQNSSTLLMMIACLKAGKTYVFIDPLLPADKFKRIVDETNLGLLIVDDEYDAILLNFEHVPILTRSDLEDLSIELSSDTLSLKIDPLSPAYILYTSGSTGSSKGVIQSHKNLLHFVSVYSKSASISSKDKLSGFSSFSFDSVNNEVYGALLNGATYYPLDLRKEGDADIIGQWLIKNEISIVQLIPSLFRVFAQQWQSSGLVIGSLRIIKMTGEPIRSRDFTYFKSISNSNAQFIVSLGLTECSLFLMNVLSHSSDIKRMMVPVGYPVSRTEIILVDEWMEEVNILEKGEILVHNEFLTPGYVDQNYNYDRFWEKNGKRYLRTGDIGRVLHDGQISWIERNDFQVKIHGIRIELGEIEFHLLNFPGVIESVSWTSKNSAGEEVLIAFFVGKEICDINKIRSFLLSVLPMYMLPEYIVQVSELPRTVSGKIDRKNLKLPSYNDKFSSIYPRNSLEFEIYNIWKSVLKCDEFGVTDSFFILGGNSFKAIELTSAINKKFNVAITVKDIFENHMIDSLSVLIKQKTTNHFYKIPSGHVRQYYDLTDSQFRIWIMSQSMPYNIIAGYYVYGTLRTSSLNAAFNLLINRHESLRTAFITQNGFPKQRIRSVEDKLVDFNFQNVCGSKMTDHFIEVTFDRETHHIFDLANDPLIRVNLYQVDTDVYMLFLTLHHIISDGWSMEVLSKELIILYNYVENNVSFNLPVLERQYKDYLLWYSNLQYTSEFEEDKKYWLTKFIDGIQPLEIRTDFPRSANKTFKGKTLDVAFDQETSEIVLRFSNSHHTSVFVFLLTIINLLFHKETKQEDIIIGTIVAGREPIDSKDQVGLYLSSLPVRTKLKSDQSFHFLLKVIQNNFLEALDHQCYPIGHLANDLNLKKNSSRDLFFDIVLIMHNTGDLLDELASSSKFKFKKITNPYSVSKYDITFNVYRVRDSLSMVIEYNSQLFEEITIKALAEKIKYFISQVNLNANMKLSDFKDLGNLEITSLENKNSFDFDF